MRTPASVRLVFALLALLAPTAPALAQTPLQVFAAEMALPFGSADVHLVLVADQILVIDESDPTAAFAIDRSNIRTIDRDSEVVTLRLDRAVRDQREMRFRLDEAAALANWQGRPSAGSLASSGSNRSSGTSSASRSSSGNASDIAIQAKHNHRLRGDCVGQLIIMDDRVSYESVSNLDHSRSWFFADIREVKQDGIYKLEVTPFLDNAYDFEFSGRGLNSQEFGFLVDRIAAARAR